MIKKLILVGLIFISNVSFADMYSYYQQHQYQQEMLRQQQEQNRILEQQQQQQQEAMNQQRMYLENQQRYGQFKRGL